MLLPGRNQDTIASLEHLGTAIERHFETTFENQADMTDATSVRRHFWRVLDQPQFLIASNDHLVTYPRNWRFPFNFVKVDFISIHPISGI